MKVLMINKFLYPNGGTETYILKFGEFLTKMGHDVQYFGMEHEQRCVGNRVNAYTKYLDFHGKNSILKAGYAVKTIYSIEARKKIRLVLDDFKPDICHLNNFNYQLTPSIILEIQKWRKEGNKCKIVYTAHDSQLICPNHLLYNPYAKKLCEKCLDGKYINCILGKCIHGSGIKSAIGMIEAYYWHKRDVYGFIDTIICCSGFMKQKIDMKKNFASKTIVLHNFMEAIEQKKVKKQDYVLYFGRYSEEKGIKTLLEVCRKLPEIQFVFAGKGPMESEVDKVENIRNVGFLTGKMLDKVISEARFVVYPSECYENCPFTIMESLAYGTPVLGADIGGIPELITNGKTGELFESKNEQDLNNRILRLWNNEDVTNQYAANCKEEKLISIEKYYEEVMKIYVAGRKNVK
ncbi:glycosyltransferase family 4 protein [Acetatifactor aquisgranensis]|uniref:glycosyltransferase family 4 protein n=1 Tax=Acetatifactor aquisgranensis TaxID=2941233 RepID=UPI002040BA15|nr:glycosyltransferase family 4 protein [Acetatifactor aquisgranensis]